jgi:hypothetical protein
MAKYTDYELEELYKDFIDDTTEIITIWGMEYSPSQVLLNVDPIAFRVGFNDWLDAEECECENSYSECICGDDENAK